MYSRNHRFEKETTNAEDRLMPPKDDDCSKETRKEALAYPRLRSKSVRSLSKNTYDLCKEIYQSGQPLNLDEKAYLVSMLSCVAALIGDDLISQWLATGPRVMKRI